MPESDLYSSKLTSFVHHTIAARRQQPSTKKGHDGEGKEAAGDFKSGHMKDNDASNVPEEGFGDVRKNRRLGGRRKYF